MLTHKKSCVSSFAINQALIYVLSHFWSQSLLFKPDFFFISIHIMQMSLQFFITNGLNFLFVYSQHNEVLRRYVGIVPFVRSFYCPRAMRTRPSHVIEFVYKARFGLFIPVLLLSTCVPSILFITNCLLFVTREAFKLFCSMYVSYCMDLVII